MDTLLLSIRAVLLGVVGAGLVWPVATALLGSVVFPEAAQGSLLRRGDEVVVGSALVGQRFVHPGYLHGRPSAANHDPRAAAGSNAAASNPALRDRVQADAAALAASTGTVIGAAPPEALAASGSGLDPHISPAHASMQVGRVAATRGVSSAQVEALLAEYTERGLLAPPRINVLRVNLALDAAHPLPGSAP